MRKEIIIAILIGISLGLIITYGVYRARTTITKQPTISPIDISENPSPETKSLSNLAITFPKDESIQYQPNITVAGTTTANSFVIIIINDQENITTADETGNFSLESKIETGSNIIQIFAIDENGNQSTQERTVIFVQDTEEEQQDSEEK